MRNFHHRVPVTKIVMLFGCGIAAAHANASPNVAGEWKVNVQKSDFGMLVGPKAAKVTITQDGDQLKLAESETNEQDETTQTESAFVTDGTPCSGTLVGTHYPVTGVMSWSDGGLTFDATGSSGDVDFKVHETWALSADRSTLTISRRFISARGNTDQTLVLEKQVVATPGGSTGASLRIPRGAFARPPASCSASMCAARISMTWSKDHEATKQHVESLMRTRHDFDWVNMPETRLQVG